MFNIPSLYSDSWYLSILSFFPFVSGIISLGILIYIITDAVHNRRNYFLWPMTVFFSGIIFFIGPISVLILYIATKDKEGVEYSKEQDMAQGIKRAYFYIFSFIALGILFFGVADLIRVILDYNWISPDYNWTGSVVNPYYQSYSFTKDSFTRNVSFRLATIIVILPIWFFHWYHIVTNLLKTNANYDLKITFKTHRAYLYLISGITLIILIIFGIWFVYQFLNLLLGVSNIKLQSFAAPIGYTFASLITFVYHFSRLRGKEFKEFEEYVKSIPPSPVLTNLKSETPKSSGGKFCPKCGIKNNIDSAFCTACGSKIS